MEKLIFSHTVLDDRKTILKCGDGLMDFGRGRRSVELRIIREKLIIDFMCLNSVGCERSVVAYIHHEQVSSLIDDRLDRRHDPN